MENFIKLLAFWLLFLPFLIVWSVIKGVFIGFFGAIIGLIQRCRDLIRAEKARNKRYPVRGKWQYFVSRKLAMNSNDQYRLEDTKIKFAQGKEKRPSLFVSALVYAGFFLAFCPFFVIYGVFYRGPLSTFQSGINFWNRKFFNKGSR